MYINDIHILYYTLVAILGGVVGQFVDYCNKIFLKDEKVLSKKNFKEYAKICTPNYVLILVTMLSYILLLYTFGKTDIIKLSMYMFLVPMLLSAFVVDYKIQIIPNRLNLTMFEIGLIFVFIYGITNLSISMDMLLGMLTGGGIFLLITLIGGAIAGKEAMGLGDVKLMGALGLYFGFASTITISVMSFLIGAIVSIILMIIRKNKMSSYIPFGPFIVTAAIISIFVPFNIIFSILMKIFSLGLY